VFVLDFHKKSMQNENNQEYFTPNKGAGAVTFLTYIGEMPGLNLLHTEIIEAKALRTVVRVYFLFNKLILHKAVIRSVMTYACPPGNLRQIPIF
jgi:hypothetical protein